MQLRSVQTCVVICGKSISEINFEDVNMEEDFLIQYITNVIIGPAAPPNKVDALTTDKTFDYEKSINRHDMPITSIPRVDSCWQGQWRPRKDANVRSQTNTMQFSRTKRKKREIAKFAKLHGYDWGNNTREVDSFRE